jgi:hypothetical protein
VSQFEVNGLVQSVAENDPRNDTKSLEEKFVFFSARSWIVLQPFKLGHYRTFCWSVYQP